MQISTRWRIQQLNLVTQTKMLPAQQRNWHVAVLPQIVVESSQTELLLLIQSRVGEEFDDLEFADLIGDCLARRGCEEDGLLSRRAAIDGDNLFQIIGGLIDGEFSDGQFYVDFDTQ